MMETEAVTVWKIASSSIMSLGPWASRFTWQVHVSGLGSTEFLKATISAGIYRSFHVSHSLAHHSPSAGHHHNLLLRVHVVNIVTLASGKKYMVDVSFGGDGATCPLPLVEDEITTNLGSQEVRLASDYIPGQTKRPRDADGRDKLWIYQYRNKSSLPWNSYYAFSEFEFLESDLEMMSYWTSQSPASFQTNTVLVVKFLEREGKIVGKLTMANDVIKRNDGEGGTRVVTICVTEEERVAALHKEFGIWLTEEEKMGIRGWKTELKG